MINGYVNHVHVLISLETNQNLAEIIKLIKGESSFWINKQNFYHWKFSWQDDYYAISVSPGHVGRIREYIKTQVEHHKKYTLDKEMEEFQRKVKENYSGGKD